jgi:hypothetical protein
VLQIICTLLAQKHAAHQQSMDAICQGPLKNVDHQAFTLYGGFTLCLWHIFITCLPYAVSVAPL